MRKFKVRMKIFHIFSHILCMISGPVGCYDVIGYSGGSAIIYYNHQQYGTNDKYFCKMKQKYCEKLIDIQMHITHVYKDGVSMYFTPGTLTVVLRQLSLQDSGIYNCGETGIWHKYINLKVNQDPCCTGPKTLTGYLGEAVTIRCTYPQVFETNNKFLFKQDSLSIGEIISTRESSSHTGRFSMSDDRSAKTLSVNINDVRESDEGVYYCGVWNGDESVSYYSFFTEIQLHVTDQPESQPERSSTQPPEEAVLGAPAGSSVVITICICVILLLIGGSAATLHKLKCNNTHASVTPNTQIGAHDTIVDYENDPPGNQNIRMGLVGQSLDPNTNQSDANYQSLDPSTNQSDTDYLTLDKTL